MYNTYTYFVRCFEKSLDTSDLIDERDIGQERVGWRAVGSGKFVVLNGSVSSRYCIRHWSVVAMLMIRWYGQTDGRPIHNTRQPT